MKQDSFKEKTMEKQNYHKDPLANNEWGTSPYDDNSLGGMYKDGKLHRYLRLAGFAGLFVLGCILLFSLFWVGSYYIWPWLVFECKAFQGWLLLPIIDIRIWQFLICCLVILWLR